MTPEQLKIWFAGFYEGEGCVSNDISNNNRIRLSISQNDPTPLKKAVEIWGGSLRKRVRKSPASDKVCIGYEWRLCHKDSIKFINDTKPFMIIPTKIKQIDEALKKTKAGLNRRFKCNFCKETYASPSGRRRHEKKNHQNPDASPTLVRARYPNCGKFLKSTLPPHLRNLLREHG